MVEQKLRPLIRVGISRLVQARIKIKRGKSIYPPQTKKQPERDNRGKNKQWEKGNYRRAAQKTGASIDPKACPLFPVQVEAQNEGEERKQSGNTSNRDGYSQGYG